MTTIVGKEQNHGLTVLIYPGKIRVKLWFIPVGSTSRASLMASDVAISWLAGDIASMMQFGYKIKYKKITA